DREFIPGRLRTHDGGGEPVRDFGGAGIRDLPVDVTLLVGITAVDQAVALESFEGVVDLADIEWPGRARTTIELRTQLIAVARALIEDGEQAQANRQEGPPEVVSQ